MATLYGGEFADTLTGGADDDLILSYEDDDRLSGDAGNDTLDGGDGDDVVDGGSGDDRIITRGGADTLIGGDGEDALVIDTSEPVDLTASPISGIERLDLAGDGHEVRLTAEQLAGFGAVSGSADFDLLVVEGEAGLDGTAIAGIEKLAFTAGHFDLRGATLDGAGTLEMLTPNGTLVLGGDQLAGITRIVMDPDTAAEGPPDRVEIHVSGTGGTIDFGHIDLQGVEGVRLVGSAGDDVFIIQPGTAGTSVGFAPGDTIRIAGLDLSGPVTAGDGSALTQGQVQLRTESGVSHLEIGVDATAGADLRVTLDGVFEAGRFAVSGSDILYTPPPSGGGGGDGGGGGGGGDDGDDAPAPPVATGPILGSPTGDVLAAGPEDDTLFAGEGDDSVMGGLGNDVLYGNQGADVVYGNIGADTIFGGQDADTLFGGQDADALYGNMADDVLYGNLGADTLFGGQGDDTLFGGQGDDVIAGNLGNDVLAGNLGADTFVFAPGGGADVVSDFQADQGDRLQLAAGMSRTVGAGAGGAVVSFGNGDQVTLAGIDAQNVQAGWFVTG
ncbi:MAG TPA: calcium-binding protein [Azospirillum sp.]